MRNFDISNAAAPRLSIKQSDYDDDADAIIESIAEGLGKSPKLVMQAMLSSIARYEAQADIIRERAKFENSAAAGVEVRPLVLANSTPVTVDLFATQDGRHLDELTILVDGGGTTSDADDDVVLVDVYGREANPEPYMVQAGNKPLVIPWHGVFVRQTHRLVISAPSAGATVEQVRVYIQGNVGPVDFDKLRHGRALLREKHGDGFGIRKFRDVVGKQGLRAAALGLQSSLRKGGVGALQSRAGGVLSDFASFAGLR